MDLKNPKWMYLKAGMFVLMGVVCFGLLLLDHPSIRGSPWPALTSISTVDHD